MTRHHSRAAILSIGDELTLGQTLNTNSKWLAERLLAVGVVTVEHATVPDDLGAQAAALQRLAGLADVVVVSGGLGPTSDDLTRQALALACNDRLVEDPVSLAQVESWFGSRGREMPDINRVQALRPSRAASIQNLHGTAPGIHATLAGATAGGVNADVFCLPGPPGEMIPMFEAAVLPRLRIAPGIMVLTAAVHCFGIGESEIATRLGALMDRDANPLVGTTASGGVVSCRVRFEGTATESEARQRVQAVVERVQSLVRPFGFSASDASLPRAIVERLAAARETIGVVESCTGGRLGGMITDVVGSSKVFVGGLLTYSNEMKVRLAGVDPALLAETGSGAVSSEMACAMAKGGLDRLGCTHCLAITGIAGPGGAVAAAGSRPAKPVGLVYVSHAQRSGCTVRAFKMAGDRQAIRDWSAKAALMMVWLGRGEPVKMLREVTA